MDISTRIFDFGKYKNLKIIDVFTGSPNYKPEFFINELLTDKIFENFYKNYHGIISISDSDTLSLSQNSIFNYLISKKISGQFTYINGKRYQTLTPQIMNDFFEDDNLDIKLFHLKSNSFKIISENKFKIRELIEITTILKIGFKSFFSLNKDSFKFLNTAKKSHSDIEIADGFILKFIGNPQYIDWLRQMGKLTLNTDDILFLENTLVREVTRIDLKVNSFKDAIIELTPIEKYSKYKFKLQTKF